MALSLAWSNITEVLPGLFHARRPELAFFNVIGGGQELIHAFCVFVWSSGVGVGSDDFEYFSHIIV